MDLATLGLAVDSREVVDASADLDRLREAASKAERQADSFGRRVEDAGRKAAAANDNSAKAADRATKAYDGYSKAMIVAARAMGVIAGAAIGTALIRYADAWSDMQSRVGAAVRDMEAAPALMQRIVDIANASYSPLDQTVEVYSRNVAVLRDLGRGATEAADFTEALNHALVLTATRGERAASVQNALSKAMAVGKLQADGLETVLANGGEVAQVLADALGTNVNGLRAMASQGKITGDVIASALIGRLDDLRERAGEMPETIGDAFVRIQTNLTAFIGQMDKASGASEMLAGLLRSLADNIGRVVTYGATAVTMFGTYYVAAMVAANLATITLTGALTFLRAALIRTGIGALVIGAGELVYQFGELVRATGSFGAAMALIGNVAREVWDRIKIGGQALQMELSAVALRIKASFLDAWAAIAAGFGRMMEAIGAGYNAIASRLPGFVGDWTWDASGVSEYAREVERAAQFTHQLSDNAGSAAEALYGDMKAPLESLDELRRSVESVSDATLELGSNAAASASAVEGAAGKAAKSALQLADQLRQVTDAVIQQAETTGVAEELARQLSLERAEVHYSEQLSILNKSLEAQLISRTRHAEMVEALAEQHEMELARITYEGAAMRTQAEQSYLQFREQAANQVVGLLGMIGQESRAAAIAAIALNKALMIAQTIQNTAAAAAAALAPPPIGLGPVAGMALAARVKAFGVLQIAAIAGTGLMQIANTGRGGAAGAGNGYGANTTAAANSNQPAQPQQAVTINLQGDVYSRQSVEELIKEINDAQSDGHVIVRVA